MARLLVVDDERDVRDLIVKRLRADGHDVLAADSGAAALPAVARHGLPEAAILDVDLPGMDGIELLERHDVHADPVLLRQLLDNLVGNAVKYAAPGTVPHIAIASAPEPGGFVRVEVADNGIGIPPGQHDAIFTNFHRAHRSSGYAGTGLGLAICKRIVERHGGMIAAFDNPGGGSLFAFTLPAALLSSPVPGGHMP